MENNKIAQRHDSFFKTAMSDVRVARDFFNSYLPSEISSVIDFNQLKLEPRSFINDVRKESIVDILYKTKIKNQDALLYLLLEHQSSPDKLMPFRILKYICNIMDHHIKQTNSKELPLIYPMVLYHAKQHYPFSTDIKDLVKAPKELVDQYFLKPFQLIDLGKVEDDVIKEHMWSCVMEFALKYSDVRDLVQRLDKIVDNLRILDLCGGSDYIYLMFQYTMDSGEINDANEFYDFIKQKISAATGDRVMTLSEKLRKEGSMEGIMKVAKNLLASNVELSIIAKSTGLPIDIIESLSYKNKETA